MTTPTYATSAGSCYSWITHAVTCNVAENACTSFGTIWSEPGALNPSPYAGSCQGCCLCGGSCNHELETPEDCSTCYYDEPVDSSGAGGDPHVTTLNGIKFDIMQVGKLNMVTVSPAQNEASDLKIDVVSSRVSGNCSAIFLEDSVISGKWLGGQDSKLAVKVVHWVPSEQALQILTNEGQWQPVLSAAKKGSNFVTKVTAKHIQFNIKDITIDMSLGLNIRKVDKNQGYNFLNLQVRGLKKLDPNVRLTGLLAGDDHSGVSEVPEECRHRKKEKSRVNFARDATASDTQGEVPEFLSFATADDVDFE